MEGYINSFGEGEEMYEGYQEDTSYRDNLLYAICEDDLDCVDYSLDYYDNHLL